MMIMILISPKYAPPPPPFMAQTSQPQPASQPASNDG